MTAADDFPQRTPRDLNAAIRGVTPTLSAVAGIRLELQLSRTPVLVAAHRDELERILINLVLNTCDSFVFAEALIVTTDTVTNPTIAGTPLPKGRYGRLIISDAVTPARAISRTELNSAASTVSPLKGRVTVERDVEGGTRLVVLVPFIAAI